MPDLTTELGGQRTGRGVLDEDLRSHGASQKSRTRKDTGPKVDTRAAVDAVLALMRPAAANGNGTTAPARPAQAVLPSSRARQALELLAQFGTVEQLEAARLDMKALCRDLFDWGVPAGTSRATKAVVKAAAAALLARDEQGVSRFSQAVEMLSFASAVAPMLEPDRLARLIAHAPQTSSAFAPERYTMQLASAARTVLGRYPDQRRETLLVSLWDAAHNGRWWDMTSGVLTVKGAAGHDVGGLAEAQAQAAEAIVGQVLGDALEGTDEAHEKVMAALMEGELAYNAGTRRLITAVPATQERRAWFATQAARMRSGGDMHPDTLLMSSLIPWLAPMERPETPLTWLVKTLVTAITPDPETGEAAIEQLPDKPRTFAELYPQAELTGFPFPREIRNLHQTLLPGTTDVLIEVVINPAELAENRDYMGNCTYGFKAQMEKGSYVLLKLWRGRDRYNASMRHSPTAWTVGEINSRFNRGGVPDDIRGATHELARRLPPPGPLADVQENAGAGAKRRVRYAVA